MRTVLITGTSHEYQRLLPGSSDPEPEQFRIVVTTTCQQKGVKAIAEEMSFEALERHGVHQSVCQQVADALRIPHRFCDPSSQERRDLGIIEDDDIRLRGFFADQDQQEVEAKVRASYGIRERRWLEYLLELDSWPVMFVCGADHVEPFRALLKANDVAAHVLFTNWEPN